MAGDIPPHEGNEYFKLPGVTVTSVAFSLRGNEVTLYTDLGKYCISAADLRALGIKTDEFPVFLEDKSHADLDFLNTKLKAVKYLSYLLSFGDKSEKALITKLKEKEFSQEVSNEAIEVLRRAGLLDEAAICGRKMRVYASEKGYGPFRIKRELVLKGFAEESIKRAFDETEIDFFETLEKLCRRLYVKRGITDRRKLSERLIRYGYSYGDIKEAIDEYEFDE